MDRLLQFLLSRFIQRGTFKVTTSRGRTFTCGDNTGKPVAVRFTTRPVELGILLDPDSQIWRSLHGWHAGRRARHDCRRPGDHPRTTNVVAQLGVATMAAGIYSGGASLNSIPARGRRRNVAHHYDLDGRLYSLFLDADRQYSCGYFEKPDTSLDDAQLAKKRHLAAKLRLSGGQRVLDIGCGWGGLGLYLAEFGGANVTGITLSQEQHAIANERAAEKNLSDRAHFLLEDYRDLHGPFDRIVSVGMFEHVGVGHDDTFFKKCAALLSDDGVMVLHSIGRSEGPGVTNPWIAKYIFPGGYIPALSEVLPEVERAGLLVTDIEILRLHYAETLKAWRERFSPIGKMQSASSTRDLCGCGDFISPRRRCPSASRI